MTEVPREWPQLRPLFESMFFDLDYREVAARTGISHSQVFALMNGQATPHPRTRRDIARALEEWYSETERQARA